MAPHTARIDRSGRLVIPSALRSQLELRDGDEVVFVVEPGERDLHVIPRRAAVQRAQAIVRQHLSPGPSIVDELIRGRRAEAADEAQRRRRQRR